MRKIKSCVLAMLCGLVWPAGSAWALDNQWYFGLGGGVTVLEPNPDQPGLNVDENQGTLGSIFFGRDLDERSSAQLQFYSFGEAELDDGETVEYAGFDASVLYRLFDTRDRQLRRGALGTSLYGRFGLGYADRDTDVEIGNDQNIYFGIGAGAEFNFSRNFAVRAEAFYHDEDIVTAQLALVTRFGGLKARRTPPQLPSPGVQADTTPEVNQPAADEQVTAPAAQVPDEQATTPSVPAPSVDTKSVIPSVPVTPSIEAPQVPRSNETPQTKPLEPLAKSTITAIDNDGDGVPNTLDECKSSHPGYPVLGNGCPLLDGVLSEVQFVDQTSELAEGATVQLDYLANLLKRYPDARIELLAHTDSRGDVREQSILTRARLRTVGTYLIGQGIRANRLVLRSFGGTRPIYDNARAAGRLGNNRIEVIEHHAAK